MKWGVRRYKDYDGHLTKAGKKRYGRKQKSRSDKLRKLAKVSVITAGSLTATAAGVKIANRILISTGHQSLYGMMYDGYIHAKESILKAMYYAQ